MVTDRDQLAAEMVEIVRLAAEPRPVADSVKGAINRAARALGITYRRTTSLWYGRTERVRVTKAEVERLRLEHTRLLALRLERLERESVELKRLLNEAERRNAAAQGATGPGGDVGGWPGATPGPVAAAP